MDNIIWLIVATALIVALGGILLFTGTDSLSQVSEAFADFINISRDPDNATDDLTGGFFEGVLHFG